jgi:putative nucleotidyltransferase-like protein
LHLTPEFRLFCLALRRPQRPEDLAALRAAAAAQPKWATLIDGARRHRLAPLVLGGLEACGSADVPAGVVEELRRQTLAAVQRSLAQIAELTRLSRLFAEAGIRVLTLKGVVLSAQFEGNGAQRGARDIDLLIDPGQFAEAETVLARAGYRSVEHGLSPRQDAAYRRWFKDLHFVHPASGMPIELHHRLTDNPVVIPCDFAALWQEREEVCLGGAVFATLPRRRLALYLCAHGAGHGWERLRWLVDLAMALAEPGSVDAALQAADGAGLDAAMLHAVMLAHEWLGLPVAEHHLARARAARRVAYLDRILAHLYAGEAWHQMPRRGSLAALRRYSLSQRLYRLSLKSGWPYRGRQALREFLSPADWDTVRLPDSLFWAYPLVRPAGWLMRRARR